MTRTLSFGMLRFSMLRFICAAVFTVLCSLQPAWAAVNANTASVEELQTVRGIGPTIAERIVQERGKGPYKSLDDLQARVRGVGSNSVKKMAQGGLTVSGGGSRTARTPAKTGTDSAADKPVTQSERATASGKAEPGKSAATKPAAKADAPQPAGQTPKADAAKSAAPAAPAAKTDTPKSAAPAVKSEAAAAKPVAPAAKSDTTAAKPSAPAAAAGTDKPSSKSTDSPSKP